MLDFTISPGFREDERPVIGDLYWEAFASKLHYVMGPRAKGHAFIQEHLNPEYALVARDAAGGILGVAGFKTREGALINGHFRDVAATYGWLSTLWRAPLLSLMERDLSDDVLLMDGLCVSQNARGMGLGTALLEAIKSAAVARGLTAVRLDVIDTNPRARALYERQGFSSIDTENLGLLRYIFGFSSATKMIWRHSQH